MNAFDSMIKSISKLFGNGNLLVLGAAFAAGIVVSKYVLPPNFFNFGPQPNIPPQFAPTQTVEQIDVSPSQQTSSPSPAGMPSNTDDLPLYNDLNEDDIKLVNDY